MFVFHVLLGVGDMPMTQAHPSLCRPSGRRLWILRAGNVSSIPHVTIKLRSLKEEDVLSFFRHSGCRLHHQHRLLRQWMAEDEALRQ